MFGGVMSFSAAQFSNVHCLRLARVSPLKNEYVSYL
jgi:hypothetical protein